MQLAKKNKIYEKLTDNIMKFQALFALITLILILSFATDTFLTVSNLMNVSRQVSINAIVAAGVTMVILAGEIDLSVGSLVGLAGAVSAGLVASGMNPVLGLLVGIIVGILAGAINGIISTKGKVPSFITTLGMMTTARGLTLVFTNGRPITVTNRLALFLGDGYIGPVPMPIITMIIIYIIGYIISKHTLLGRYIYAIGSNEEATRLSGINVNLIKSITFVMAGITAAIGGIIVSGRIYSAQPTAGTGYELDAIAAVVLGGTSLSGGKGGIVGTLIGALIIGILGNGLNLLGVSSFYQQVIKGVVIVLAVLIDQWSKNK